MRNALHEYRDEASLKVRRSSAIARSEAGMEDLYRKRHGRLRADLRLDQREREILAGWRERRHPVEKDQTVRLDDDPTQGEAEISPLEAESGLTWSDAASGTML